MNRYLPQYRDIYSKDTMPGLTTRMSGEYRVCLRGPDGRVKYKTDWKPNMVTDTGLYWSLQGAYSQIAFLSQMFVGDSDTPVAETQSTLQGNNLGRADTNTSLPGINGGATNYERITTTAWKYYSGNGTGTIKEFVLTPYNDSGNGASVRVVLDAPIVKGAQDELDIEHRFTWWPPLGDVSGVIDISGEAYDYTIRSYGLTTISAYRPASVALVGHSNYSKYYDSPLQPTTTNSFSGWVGDFQDNPASGWVSGTAPNYVATLQLRAGITANSGNISLVVTAIENWIHLGIGAQFSLAKVSDGTPLVKLNTHELHLFPQTYSARYVP